MSFSSEPVLAAMLLVLTAIASTRAQVNTPPPYEIVVIERKGNFVSVECRVSSSQFPLVNATFFHDGIPEGEGPCLPPSTSENVYNFTLRPGCDGYYFCGGEYNGGLVFSDAHELYGTAAVQLYA